MQCKVLYILNDSTPYGGANKSFLNMIDGLILNGIKPFVILPTDNGIIVNLKDRGLPCYVIPIRMDVFPSINNFRDICMFIPRIFRILFINKKAYWKILSLTKEIKPALIHTNVGPIHTGFNVAIKIGIPHVWHIREYQDLDFKMKPLFSMDRFVLKLNSINNFPIVITESIYKHFSLKFPAKVISNGVLSSTLVQFDRIKEKYFLFAGRLEESKGIKETIRAFSEFNKINSEYYLYLAGDTEDSIYMNSLVELIEKLNITNRVLFLGMRNDISNLMAKATALIMSSRYEGFGRVTAEAMFNGCLVIGRNTGGTKEILEKERLGLLFLTNEEMVELMKDVVADGVESYFSMIMEAQKFAINNFSNEQNVNKVIELYKEILSIKR
ncbi:glycosyltransferase [Flavobacterium sp. 5]|uniref:glycosyltransferase n=1 Tax=Flavobacterium sp. 5 TaxID=2035199 RepID=UPI000C2B5BB5|nr:glycosyltransferase [Flavobacterium sp. 5]PKB17429.1 glycosyltransferase involved in cell wall biosynthesis [Flavobacterium sp. 5]